METREITFESIMQDIVDGAIERQEAEFWLAQLGWNQVEEKEYLYHCELEDMQCL